MHNLTTLIKRLEAATSRLEDVASSTIQLPVIDGAQGHSHPIPSTILSEKNVENYNYVPEELPDSVREFDAFISGSVQKFVKASEDLGDPISEQAHSVLEAFYRQRKFILITTKAKKPDMNSPILMQLLKPLQESITVVSEIRDSNRGSPFLNQLSAVSDSIGVLAWVTVESKPPLMIEEFFESAKYWGNRVLKEFKDTDQKQIEWTQSYYGIFKTLSEYVKQTFPSGLLWNPQGIQAEEAIIMAESKTPIPTVTNSNIVGVPPPPPPPPGPPPPPIIFDDALPESSSKNTTAIGAVFSEINKGSEITKGLKKVSSDQMTHKNPSLRASSTAISRTNSSISASSIGRPKSPAPGKKPKPENMRTRKPSIKKLDGNKWFIENFEDESEPIKIPVSINQSILISRCKKSTIIIEGKANAMSIDNSPNLSILVDSLVSSIDIIKSSNFAMQVLGTVPTIMLDTVDGAQIYLGKDSLGTEVFSSKSNGINLNIQDLSTGNDNEFKEIPLPGQIRSWIEEGKVKNDIVEHAG